MIKKFVFALLCCLPAFSADAQSPDTPLPEADFKITLPQSGRTKDNIADIVLDFLLTKAFSRLKNATVSYDFFELGEQGMLHFSNFSLQLEKPSVSGKITFKKLTIGAKELLAFLETHAVMLGKVAVQDAVAGLTIGKQQKKVVFTARELSVEQLRLARFSHDSKDKSNEEIAAQRVSGTKALYKTPSHCYRADSFSAENTVVRVVEPFGVTFENARLNQKSVSSPDEAMRAAENACGKRR